jgi:hypothetical protein
MHRSHFLSSRGMRTDWRVDVRIYQKSVDLLMLSKVMTRQVPARPLQIRMHALRALREARTHGVLALHVGPCSDIHRRLAGQPVQM